MAVTRRAGNDNASAFPEPAPCGEVGGGDLRVVNAAMPASAVARAAAPAHQADSVAAAAGTTSAAPAAAVIARTPWE